MLLIKKVWVVVLHCKTNEEDCVLDLPHSLQQDKAELVCVVHNTNSARYYCRPCDALS